MLFYSKPSMSPRIVRRQIRMRIIIWLGVLLCSGSVLGIFAYKRWEELGEGDIPTVEADTEAVWQNTTDGGIARIREAVEKMDVQATRVALNTKLSEVPPDTAIGQYLRGWVLELEGNPEGFEITVSAFTNACMADPKAMFPHYTLGLLYFENGHIDMAIAEFETAITNNSRYADAHFALGSSYLKKGDLESAANSYGLAIRLDPVKASYYYNMGIVYEQQSRLGDAVASYTKCIQLDPALAPAYYNLGRIQEFQGHPEEAKRMYEVYLEREPDPQKREKVEQKLRQNGEIREMAP